MAHAIDPRVAKLLSRVDPIADVFDKVAAVRDLSLAERGRLLRSLCDLAARVLEARPDRDRALATRSPLSAESEARWRSLVAAGRNARG